ncbi:transfer RNA:arg:12Ea [Drosophila simulans]|uniref:Transfer RNA:arg:12Ea n=1 Tax=Drosophila simulans TaxID=7240 RepID=B4R4L5_DROSI|nr:transfer RNA:arg:12Ea [Drosophila simulans]
MDKASDFGSEDCSKQTEEQVFSNENDTRRNKLVYKVEDEAAIYVEVRLSTVRGPKEIRGPTESA